MHLFSKNYCFCQNILITTSCLEQHIVINCFQGGRIKKRSGSDQDKIFQFDLDSTPDKFS